MSFVGGKGQDGLFQRIINLIPPHLVFVEGFGGLATITRRKKPAAESYVIDKARHPRLVLPPGVRFVRGCAMDFLRSFRWTGKEVVYLDPPYLLSTRGNRKYYPHEMDAEEHARLLTIINEIPARVILSGYRSPLYDDALTGWNLEEVRVYTRHHEERRECLWFNFPRPAALHEYTCAGENNRDRFRIKRKAQRWAERLKRQTPVEQAALFSALVDVMGAGAVRLALNDAAARVARSPASPETASLDPAEASEMTAAAGVGNGVTRGNSRR